MFTNLKRLWNENKITIEQLRNAVGKGWITIEQFKEICGEDY